MVDPQIVREWLDKAEEDFGFACSVLEETDYFGPLCFHFQQSAEKFLKAFIVANELDFVKRHDLLFLLEICLRKTPSLNSLSQACKFLNRFYIDTRYPVHWPEAFSKEHALKAKEAAEKIKLAVLRELGKLQD